MARANQGEGVPEPGETVAGKYRIDAVLGAGAMGVVLAARNTLLGHDVAIKFVTPTRAARAEALARFAREARTVASLESEHIVRLLDFGTLEEGTPYMVMQRLVGTDLMSEARARGGRLPLAEVADYAIQACVGLAEAHAHGVVHRDIKPGNLFLTRRANGEPLVKILDFGISKTTIADGADLTLTDTASLLGSPLYMSPEQVRQSKSVDHRTDIWSLGVVIHQLCVGSSPFVGEGAGALLASIAADEPTPLRDVDPEMPEALEAVVLRCLQKSAAFRYQSAAELAQSIAPFATARGALMASQLALEAVALPVAAASPTTLRPGAHRASAPETVESTGAPSVLETRPSARRTWVRWGVLAAAIALVPAASWTTWAWTRASRTVAAIDANPTEPLAPSSLPSSISAAPAAMPPVASTASASEPPAPSATASHADPPRALGAPKHVAPPSVRGAATEHVPRARPTPRDPLDDHF
jgi:serine/threonine-protein kinase